MTFLKTALLLSTIGALSACTGADRFGSGGAGANGGDVSQFGGGVSDPSSPAFFSSEAVGDRVLFAVDQSTLTPEAQVVLSKQASWLLTNTGFSALIEGHADEQGTREYNIALGARRAEAVQTYLVSQGVSPARLKTISYGKERPIEICSDESCYSQNRRSVTVLTAGSGV